MENLQESEQGNVLRHIDSELERIGQEGDEIAERLGPDIKGRLKEIANADGRWYGGLTLAGGLVGCALGVFTQDMQLKLMGDYSIPGFFATFPGIVAGMLAGTWVDRKVEEQRYRKLEQEFPERGKDIKRFRELVGTQCYLRATRTEMFSP